MILGVYTFLNLHEANKSNPVNRIKANVDHFSHFGEKTGCHFKGSSTPASMGPLSQRQAQFPPQRCPSLPVTERGASEPVRSNEAGVEGGGVEGGRVDPWRQLWGNLTSFLGPHAFFTFILSLLVIVFVQIQLVVHGCFDEILVYGSPQGHEIADIVSS